MLGPDAVVFGDVSVSSDVFTLERDVAHDVEGASGPDDEDPPDSQGVADVEGERGPDYETLTTSEDLLSMMMVCAEIGDEGRIPDGPVAIVINGKCYRFAQEVLELLEERKVDDPEINRCIAENFYIYVNATRRRIWLRGVQTEVEVGAQTGSTLIAYLTKAPGHLWTHRRLKNVLTKYLDSPDSIPEYMAPIIQRLNGSHEPPLIETHMDNGTSNVPRGQSRIPPGKNVCLVIDWSGYEQGIKEDVNDGWEEVEPLDW